MKFLNKILDVISVLFTTNDQEKLPEFVKLEEKIEEIIDVIEKLDKVENLAKLTKLLAR